MPLRLERDDRLVQIDFSIVESDRPGFISLTAKQKHI